MQVIKAHWMALWHSLFHLHRISALRNRGGHLMSLWCHDCDVVFFPQEQSPYTPHGQGGGGGL
jgi:hypothetical protein